jgi:predicted RNA-binding Zn-ribbon protein involved in translation (DUF1610 family)
MLGLSGFLMILKFPIDLLTFAIRPRCPKCGKRGVRESKVIGGSAGYYQKDRLPGSPTGWVDGWSTWEHRCPYCGYLYETTDIRDSPRDWD